MARRRDDEDITGEIVAITDRLVEQSRELMDELDERLDVELTNVDPRPHKSPGVPLRSPKP